MVPPLEQSDLGTVLSDCENLVMRILLSARIVKFGEDEMSVFARMRHTLTKSLMDREQVIQLSGLIKQILKFGNGGKIQLTEAQETILQSVSDKVHKQREQIELATKLEK